MICPTPVSQSYDSISAKERAVTPLPVSEDQGRAFFNDSDFPAHTFTLLEERRSNVTTLEEINERVMESAEEPWSQLCLLTYI